MCVRQWADQPRRANAETAIKVFVCGYSLGFTPAIFGWLIHEMFATVKFWPTVVSKFCIIVMQSVWFQHVELTWIGGLWSHWLCRLVCMPPPPKKRGFFLRHKADYNVMVYLCLSSARSVKRCSVYFPKMCGEDSSEWITAMLTMLWLSKQRF